MTRPASSSDAWAATPRSMPVMRALVQSVVACGTHQGRRPTVARMHWRDGRDGRGKPQGGAGPVRLGVQHILEEGGDPEEGGSGL